MLLSAHLLLGRGCQALATSSNGKARRARKMCSTQIVHYLPIGTTCQKAASNGCKKGMGRFTGKWKREQKKKERDNLGMIGMRAEMS